MTEKQEQKIKTIINHYGKDYVLSYIRHFYADACLNNLKKHQAQKIITGLGIKLQNKPIRNVYLRDVFC